MENTFLLTDDMLWDYADGFLNAADKTQLESYLQKHPEAQLRLQTILGEKQELEMLPLEAPEAGFANRVMTAWVAEQGITPAKANGQDWIIRLISLAMVLFILTPLVVLFFTASEMAPGVLSDFQLPELPVFDWASWLNSPILLYALLLLTATLGLRLLDKILEHQRLAHKLA